MGVVLKAFDPALNRVVAIKVLAPQMAASGAARRRFSREAKAAAAVVHDHVVAIHAVDDDPKSGLPYLVMPYIAGRSLQERIDRDGPLRTEEVLRIGMQTALGLAAAHAQGLVHRDIKPSNILLENGVERVKITDFGLARAIDDASRSQSGVVAGTPQYMSPEQARRRVGGSPVRPLQPGQRAVRHVRRAFAVPRQDHDGRAAAGLRRRAPAARGDQPRRAGIPRGLIRRLHAKDPAARYQSAGEVAEELGRQLAERQRPGVPRSGSHPRRRASRSPRPRRPDRPRNPRASIRLGCPESTPRSRLPKRAAIVLLGLLAVAAVAMTRCNSRPRPATRVRRGSPSPFPPRTSGCRHRRP